MFQHRRRFGNVYDRPFPPGTYRCAAFLEGTCRFFVVQHVGPYKLDLTSHHTLLNTKLCLRLKLNAHLSLAIEGSIEAAVVHVDSHRLVGGSVHTPNLIPKSTGICPRRPDASEDPVRRELLFDAGLSRV